MSQQIPAHLIDKLFVNRRYHKYADWLWAAIKYSTSFLLLFGLFFLALNFPAFYAKAQFAVNPPQPQPAREVIQRVEQKQPTPQITTVSDDQNNRLKIAKLELDAPVVWEVPFEQMIEKLRDGVVHYGGTGLPGQNGNVFITGHSSNFWWDKGKFNTVFANLDRLDEGDEIVATHQNIQYRYIVEKKFVVSPEKIEVLNPTDHSVISLMTCTPVGTTINRLIVQARQIDPAPGQSTQVIPPGLPDRLPAIR